MIRKRKSPSSILLFPKEKKKKIGIKHFIIDMSDLLSALENATNRDKMSCLLENGISTIPI